MNLSFSDLIFRLRKRFCVDVSNVARFNLVTSVSSVSYELHLDVCYFSPPETIIRSTLVCELSFLSFLILFSFEIVSINFVMCC